MGAEGMANPVTGPPLLPGCPWRPWLTEANGNPKFGTERRDERGRVRVWLGRGHRFADRSGRQWRYRLVVCYALGYRLPECDHVDHRDGVVDRDVLSNLRVLGAVFHGRHHARLFEVAGCRKDGKFVELPVPVPVLAQRFGAVISSREIGCSGNTLDQVA
jgi:hypothetical protein